jgi:hypothetical protein
MHGEDFSTCIVEKGKHEIWERENDGRAYGEWIKDRAGRNAPNSREADDGSPNPSQKVEPLGWSKLYWV